MDSAGNLYGAAMYGGAYNNGTVYKLTPAGSTFLYSSLHEFTGGSDGSDPVGPLVLDAAGNLYGSANSGGDPKCACGTVWMITPN